VPTPGGVTTPTETELTGYATSLGRSRNMASIRRSDTKPEIALRSALHRLGLRFRKDYPVRVNGKVIRPDIAFTRRRIAVFVDGCFWHSCPEHGRQPRVNGDYWSPKLQRNAARDREQTRALQSAGWMVVRFWEHEALDSAAGQIASLYAANHRRGGNDL
jgi:DNA mismatch endonuclease (patch repair protein)